jgi:hypothetical protein
VHVLTSDATGGQLKLYYDLDAPAYHELGSRFLAKFPQVLRLSLKVIQKILLMIQAPVRGASRHVRIAPFRSTKRALVPTKSRAPTFVSGPWQVPPSLVKAVYRSSSRARPPCGRGRTAGRS